MSGKNLENQYSGSKTEDTIYYFVNFVSIVKMNPTVSLSFKQTLNIGQNKNQSCFDCRIIEKIQFLKL